MHYPALDVRRADADLVLAIVDDFAPSAVEDLPDGVTIYFASAERRDEARAAVAAALADAVLAVRDVDDEDWAKRSQQNLTPITVGRVTVTPPWFAEPGSGPGTDVRVVILPSMGFGTGHHATTRLCLEALQQAPLAGRSVLDVGTGSGVLALAAARLGAASALGIDFDPDAVTNAHENLDLNPDVHTVRFEVVDVRDRALPHSDVVLANLTGAVLINNAARLREAAGSTGRLIVSGLQTHERDAVLAAFAPATLCWSGSEQDWVALALEFPATAA
jgi:ribosomal protein L11 methyltransferase